MKTRNSPVFSISVESENSIRYLAKWISDVFSLPENPYPRAFDEVSGYYRKEIPDFPLVSAWVAYAYSAHFATDIKRFKYRAERSVLERFDEGLRRLAEICREEVGDDAFVTYPPSPLSRTLFRGYDHTALLAERFAKHAGLPAIRLIKTPFSRPKQAGANRLNRMSNVSNKFFLPAWAPSYSGRPVIFFDDVISSGSTVLECAKILHENGNFEIRGCFLSSSTVHSQEKPNIRN
ncbi:MAG: competence protein ComFC [Patescibacteria group bacterium]|nr:competence protein ComFC [Patescibacteria group bacterium]